MAKKIFVEIDEITSRRAGQLAAEKGMGYREYLAKTLEAEIKKRVKRVDMSGEVCGVTLEISDDLYSLLVRYSGDFWSEEPAAKHFILNEIDKEWGDRG